MCLNQSSKQHASTRDLLLTVAGYQKGIVKTAHSPVCHKRGARRLGSGSGTNKPSSLSRHVHFVLTLLHLLPSPNVVQSTLQLPHQVSVQYLASRKFLKLHRPTMVKSIYSRQPATQKCVLTRRKRRYDLVAFLYASPNFFDPLISLIFSPCPLSIRPPSSLSCVARPLLKLGTPQRWN